MTYRRPDPRPHDALVKYALKDPIHAAAVLRSALPKAIAKAIDWSTLTRLRPLRTASMQ